MQMSTTSLTGQPANGLNRFRTYAGFVKLEHTVFSLPLIFAGTLLHTRGSWPSWRLVLLLVAAAVGARTVAMGLNRLIDHAIDARNPRTKGRELPRGAMRRSEAWAIVLIAGAVYALSALAIDPLCLKLAPIPVILFFIYPYLKRVTALAHLGLGLAWSMGPLAGWLAAARALAPFAEVFWLWLFSWLWVTGFDIIYATMDEAFDREAGLHSLPAELGKRKSLQVAANLHAMAFLSLYMLWLMELHTPGAFAWLAAIGGLLIWQHLVAERRPEFAFFQLNGVLGFLVLGFVLAGV
jgi:4-hydroxybenzoate polyprenyltransferase